MKQAKFILAVVFLVSMIPLTSFAAEKQKTDVVDLSQQKAQYEKNIEERLNKIGKQLDELKLKASSASKEARIEISHSLSEAEKKQKKAMVKLDTIRKKSVNEWKKLSAGLDILTADVEKAYEKAKSRFKE